MLEYANQVAELSDNERLIFQNEFQRKSKSILAGQMMALFLGSIGGHRFYLGQQWLGLAYFIGVPVVFLLAVMSQSPAIGGLTILFIIVGQFVEFFQMRKRVNGFNQNLAIEISSKIKMMRRRAANG